MLRKPKWDAEAAAIFAALESAKPNEIVTYAAMTGLCGAAIGTHHTALRRALRRALRNGVSVTCVPLVGYRRNDDYGGGTKSGKHRLKAVRQHRMGLAHAATVSPKRLDPSTRAQFYANLAALQAGLAASRRKPVRVTERKPSVADTALAVFRQPAEAAE